MRFPTVSESRDSSVCNNVGQQMSKDEAEPLSVCGFLLHLSLSGEDVNSAAARC